MKQMEKIDFALLFLDFCMVLLFRTCIPRSFCTVLCFFCDIVLCDASSLPFLSNGEGKKKNCTFFVCLFNVSVFKHRGGGWRGGRRIIKSWRGRCDINKNNNGASGRWWHLKILFSFWTDWLLQNCKTVSGDNKYIFLFKQTQRRRWLRQVWVEWIIE